MRVPIPAAGRWQQFGSCLERFRPDASRRGLANFRVYLKQGYGVKYQDVARARLTGVRFRKYRTALTAPACFVPEDAPTFPTLLVASERMPPFPSPRPAAAACRSAGAAVPLVLPADQKSSSLSPCRGLMNGRHNNVDTLVDHSPRAIHHHHSCHHPRYATPWFASLPSRESIRASARPEARPASAHAPADSRSA